MGNLFSVDIFQWPWVTFEWHWYCKGFYCMYFISKTITYEVYYNGRTSLCEQLSTVVFDRLVSFLLFVWCDSRRCREERETAKSEKQDSACVTTDDDDETSAAAATAAYDAIDISRPVSRTSPFNDRALYDVREIPWMTSSLLLAVFRPTVKARL